MLFNGGSEMNKRTAEILEGIFGIVAGIFLILWLILIVLPQGFSSYDITYFLNPYFIIFLVFAIPCALFDNMRRKAEADE